MSSRVDLLLILVQLGPGSFLTHGRNSECRVRRLQSYTIIRNHSLEIFALINNPQSNLGHKWIKDSLAFVILLKNHWTLQRILPNQVVKK